MSETRGNKTGPLNLDVALRQWPDVEKPEEEWDARAQLVVERIRAGERGGAATSVSDANLLEAPLGQSLEDGHNSRAPGGAGSAAHHPPIREGKAMTMPADRERDRRSLQDLAKMAQGLTPPPSSVLPAPSGVQRAIEGAQDKKDDSGIVDLAAASQADPSAALRAQTTPLASQGLFDEEPAHSQRPPMSAAPTSGVPMSGPVSHAPHTAPLGAQGAAAQPAPSLPPASLPPQALTPSAPPAAFGAPVAASAVSTGTQKKKGSGAVIALVVALGAAAAGGVFVMKSRSAAPESAAATVATAEPAATVAQAEPPPAKVDEPAEPAETTPAPEPSTDPDTLATSHGKIAMASKGTRGGAAKAAAPAAAPAAKPEGPAKMTEKDLAPSAGGGPADLGAAIKKEVGDDGTPKTPAAATTAGNAPAGNVPTKPSQGAVTGAIGAVLPGARACLGPDDPVSKASVVFASAGTVQNVNVSGAAAGKPAEACIKSALMKAKIAPFAEPTYTANITVRHN